MTTSEYVAFGRNEESDNPQLAYWVACWNDDGPTSGETFAATRGSVQAIAERIARERGLEVIEVDEYGAVKLDSETMKDWRYEVANGDTTLGFSEWQTRQLEARNL